MAKVLRSVEQWIIFSLVWIATLTLLTCFIDTAKDLPPSANTILSVIVGALAARLTGAKESHAEEAKK